MSTFCHSSDPARCAAGGGCAEKGGSEAGTTSIYTKVTLGVVAAALLALTGERPLAETVDAIFADAIAESVAARTHLRHGSGDGTGDEVNG